LGKKRKNRKEKEKPAYALPVMSTLGAAASKWGDLNKSRRGRDVEGADSGEGEVRTAQPNVEGFVG